MMKKGTESAAAAATYDDAIREHYDEVARTHKESSAATMEDATVRRRETDCIRMVVAEAARGMRARSDQGKAIKVIDVGCGNGYTLSQLAELVPGNEYSGLEFNESLRAVAVERLAAIGIGVAGGDIRRRETLPDAAFDVLVCQRVLINLLDEADQARALANLIDLMAEGGVAIFIEAFTAPLQNLNAARAELGLEPMPPAIHNQYLKDDFFEHPALEPWRSGGLSVEPDMLSTHYFVTRVFHEAVLRATESKFIRNSHFVRFWSSALPDAVGSYSPLRISVLTKRKSGR